MSPIDSASRRSSALTPHSVALLLAALAFAAPAAAQSDAVWLPAGGGTVAADAFVDTPDAALDAELDARVAAATERLTARGALPPSDSRNPARLVWPLSAVPHPGITWHGIASFVDHDPSDAARDFACGTRSHDPARGTRHAGTDFFRWPFPWTTSNSAKVVAAAYGTLLTKSDGVPDQCTTPNPGRSNYVVIRHLDGTQTRYLNLARDSVTTKQEGDVVFAGETIGRMGSPGLKGGPQLHFEVRAAHTNAVVDPFAGQCNARPGMWVLQRAYQSSRLNRIATHYRPPVLPSCADVVAEEGYFADRFNVGGTIHYGAYFRDHAHGQSALLRVLRPDGSVVREWRFDPAGVPGSRPFAPASHYYWTDTLPPSAPIGEWTFEASFEGETLRHRFTVSRPGACDAGAVQVTGPVHGVAGAPQTFTARISRGAPVDVAWDVEGDGFYDRTQFNVMHETSITTTYATAGSYRVRVNAPAGAGCLSYLDPGHEITIDAPQITAIPGEPILVCGDADREIEAGERWRFPVTLRNDGAPLQRGVAVFGKSLDSRNRFDLIAPSAVLPDLARGESFETSTEIAIANDAACGFRIGLDYVGTVDDVSHSMNRASLLRSDLGVRGGTCLSSAPCAARPHTEYRFHTGLYSSLARFGNGVASFTAPSTYGTLFGGQWFTGRRDRTPEWLYALGYLYARHAEVDLYRFSEPVPGILAAPGSIGEGQVTFVSPTEYVLTWDFDVDASSGRTQAGGERLALLFDATRPQPDRTGAWYGPDSPGWGVTLDDHRMPDGRAEQVSVNFFYDRDGKPVWTLGGGDVAGGASSQNLFFVHCPGCAALPDFAAHAKRAGTTAVSFDDVARGRFSATIDLPAPMVSAYRQEHVPIERASEQ